MTLIQKPNYDVMTMTFRSWLCKPLPLNRGNKLQHLVLV